MSNREDGRQRTEGRRQDSRFPIWDSSAFAVIFRQGYEGTSYGGQVKLDVIARSPAPIELRLTPNWCGTT